MSWLNDDLNLYYKGGSGGFFLFYLILLEDTHYSYFHQADINTGIINKFSFNLNHDFNYKILSQLDYNLLKGSDWPDYDFYSKNFLSLSIDLQDNIQTFEPSINVLEIYSFWKRLQYDYIIQQQYMLDDISTWKLKEYWPDNHITKKMKVPLGQNYKLFFNCNDDEEWLTYPGKKVVLYTDISAHVKLSWHKNAFWFNPQFSSENKNLGFLKEIYKKFIIYENKKVYDGYQNPLKVADKIIYLQDLITKDLESLGFSGNKRQYEFRKRWIELHANFNLLDKLLRKYNAK